MGVFYSNDGIDWIVVGRSDCSGVEFPGGLIIEDPLLEIKAIWVSDEGLIILNIWLDSNYYFLSKWIGNVDWVDSWLNFYLLIVELDSTLDLLSLDQNQSDYLPQV